MAQRPKAILIVVLALLATYRVLLIGSGQLYWQDEYRYLHAVHFMDELSKGNLTAGLQWIFGSTFDVAARPGFMLLATIPVLLQGLAHHLLGVQPSDAMFYRIPAAFNVAVSLGIAILFYRIIFLLSGDHALAVLGVVIHGLLVNTNLYVRHLFPYDWALLILLAALNVILTPGMARDTPRLQAILAGLLAGIGMTTYTPYSPLIVILVAGLIVAQGGRWRYVSTFALAILSVVVVWEIIARMGGFSYVGRLSEFVVDAFVVTVVDVKKSFGGPIFLPFYSLKVEGIAGAVLLLLFAYFWVGAVRGMFGWMEVTIIGAATALYLSYGLAAMFSHNYLFFFGRILHMYFPFVVLGAVLAIKLFPGPKLQRGVAVAMVLMAVVSFVPTAAEALAIHYPRDVGRDLIASLAPGKTVCNKVDGTGSIVKASPDCNITASKALVIGSPRGVAREPVASVTPGTKVCNRWKDNGGEIEKLASDCDVVLDNFRNLYPPSIEIVDTAPPPGFVLNAVYDHPLQFAPYLLEDFSPDARAYYAKHQAQMRVYARAIPLNKTLSTTNGSEPGGR